MPVTVGHLVLTQLLPGLQVGVLLRVAAGALDARAQFQVGARDGSDVLTFRLERSR